MKLPHSLPFFHKTLFYFSAFVLTTTVRAIAATAPYTDDFSANPASFTISSGYNSAGTGSMTWNSTNGTLDSNLNDIGEYGQLNYNWATVSMSNLDASSSNFFMSSDFTLTASADAGGSSAVGLGVTTGTNFPIFSSASYYYGEFQMLDSIGSTQGRLRIMQSDGAYGTSIVTPLTFSGFTLGTTYRMTFSGVYSSGNNLTLSFSVTDGTTTQTVSGTVANTFSGLTNFGYQHVIANAVDNTVAFDNFSLSAVPEPSTLGLALAGIAGAIWRTRKVRRVPAI